MRPFDCEVPESPKALSTIDQLRTLFGGLPIWVQDNGEMHKARLYNAGECYRAKWNWRGWRRLNQDGTGWLREVYWWKR